MFTNNICGFGSGWKDANKHPIPLLSDTFYGENGTSNNGRASNGLFQNHIQGALGFGGILAGGDGKLWTSSDKQLVKTTGGGLLYINAGALTLGSEAVINGDFNDTSAWTLTGSPHVSISGGSLNFDGAESYGEGVTQTCLSINNFYKIQAGNITGNSGQWVLSLGAGGYSKYLGGNSSTILPCKVNGNLRIVSNSGTQIYTGSIGTVSAKTVPISELINMIDLNTTDLLGILKWTNYYDTGFILNADDLTNPQNCLIIIFGAGMANIFEIVNGVYSADKLNIYVSGALGINNGPPVVVTAKSKCSQGLKTGITYRVYAQTGVCLGQYTCTNPAIINNTKHGIINFNIASNNYGISGVMMLPLNSRISNFTDRWYS